jgi:NTE family protein
MKTLAGLAAAAAFLTACSTSPPVREGDPPRFVAPPAGTVPPRVALVLSGGSARGFAHVGVIKVLEENGLRPDLIVGSSSGSMVGALYASGLTAPQLEAAVAELDRSVFMSVSLPGLGLLPGSLGLIQGDRLHRFIDDRVRHHHIERFPMLFAAVATDFATGESRILNAGDVGLAVRASSAAPGLIEPAQVGVMRLFDGQVSSPVPVDAARKLGATVVVAVDVIYPPEEAAPRTAVGALFQAFNIAVHRLKSAELGRADLVIGPEIASTSGQLSFADRERIVAAGEQAARAALPKLRAAFSR